MVEVVGAEIVEPGSASVPSTSLGAGRCLVRESIAAVTTAVVCDLMLYRGEGFAGLALLFLLSPALLLLGGSAARLNRGFALAAGMILLLSLRLVWLGSVLGVIAGFAMLVASAMCLAGRRPYVLDLVAYALQAPIAGVRHLVAHARAISQPRRCVPRLFWLNVGLPLAAVLVFGGLFILANPDLVTSCRIWVDWAWQALWESLADLIPTWTQVLVWIVAACVTIWLLRRHLWTVAIAAYLFALTPVDALVHRYNVRRILEGDPAPSVQISVHPISSEGILVLHPLLDCHDPVIREGVRALLAERAEQAEAALQQQMRQGWTATQLADRMLVDQLRNLRSEWALYADPARRTEALERFHSYAYQWY